jgi:hypothetical protein
VRDFVEQLFAQPEMLEMEHCQRLDDRNMGFGELYYAFTRLLRPVNAVVIGSWRGFSPAVIGRAMLDNSEGGELVFIEPSLVDDFWADEATVNAHFAALGAPNVKHMEATTQQYAASEHYRELSDIGLLMIDGLHTAEQARFDYLAFLDKLTPDAVVLFHDSVSQRTSRIYGEEHPYQYSVCLLIERLKKTAGLDVFTLPQARGLTLVRGSPAELDTINAPFRQVLPS